MEIVGIAIAVPLVVLGIKGYINLNSRLTITEVMLKLLLKSNGHTDASIEAGVRDELNNHKNRRRK